MTPSPQSPLRIPARVIGCMRAGYIRILIGPGMGMMDGGIEHDIPVDLIPEDLRTPNSEFLLHGSFTDIDSIHIERFSE